MCAGDYELMSIINDALKKTQTILKKTHPPILPSKEKEPLPFKIKKKTVKAKTVKTKLNITPVFLAGILLLIMGSIFLLSLFRSPKKLIRSTNIPAVQPQQPVPLPPRVFKKGELILSGTMDTKDTKVAIINGEVYSVGEKIQGKIIKAITLKTVILIDTDGNEITLDVRQSN